MNSEEVLRLRRFYAIIHLKVGDFMSETKKRNIITWVIVALAVTLVLLAVLSLILKTFVVDVILHTYVQLLFVPLIIKVLQKCFREQLSNSMNKALILCACFIVLDFIYSIVLLFINKKFNNKIK